MSIFHNSLNPKKVTSSAFTIDNSCRFNDDDSAYLSWTAGTATNRKKWTWSGWVKRGNLTYYQIFGARVGSNHTDSLFFENDKVRAHLDDATYELRTSAVLRDPSAWYHIVWAIDTTQGTASNRANLYINGTKVTDFHTETYPSSNYESGINNAVEHRTGKAAWSDPGNEGYLDGYLAEVHFIDGQQLDHTSFGETDATYGHWKPKEVTGMTYGTNGFYLDFADSADLGNDVSGEGNDWTSSGLGTTDQMLDTPTNNFCTWNPLTIGTQGTLSEGNLKNATFWSADLSGNASTFIPKSGKWYWEIRVDGVSTYPYLGITSQEKIGYNSSGGTFYNIAWRSTGASENSGTGLGTITKENISSFTNDDIISFALDVDSRKLWVAKNNTWADSGNPSNGSGENASWTVDAGVSPFISGYQSQGVGTVANFGQDDTFAGNDTGSAGPYTDGTYGSFYYEPPSGFKALCTANLDDPAAGLWSGGKNVNFNTVTYTGNNTDNHAITGVGFQPDLVWTKVRSTGDNHMLWDAVRGANKTVYSDATNAERDTGGGGYEGVKSFDSDGFTLGLWQGPNWGSKTFVAWNWNCPTTFSGNNNGSITSSGRKNTSAGFSIVSYTGNGTDGSTVGHGLNLTPDMVLVKRRSGVKNWAVLHKYDSTKALILNSTSAAVSGSGYWSNTAPTINSDYFRVADNLETNGSSDTYIAYCFHSVDGYSKVGSYTGNGSSDGTFVYTGFRPKYFMWKRSNAGGAWGASDSERSPYNEVDDVIYTSDSIAEYSNTSWSDIDFTSNGIKMRTSDSFLNSSGDTFIYIAFAEFPFSVGGGIAR